MTYLIGTDEAGYGPNLGPLVVAATAWEVPDRLPPETMYDALAEAVRRETPRNGEPVERITIADSKAVYKPRGTLAHLERGVHAALGVLGRPCTNWRAVWETLSPEALPWEAATAGGGLPAAPPWYTAFDRSVPLEVDVAEASRAAERLGAALSDAGIRLRALRARAVFPHEFNRGLAACNSKGALLSQVTLGLAAQLCDLQRDGPILVLCDKHGGRNHYREHLEAAFPDWLIEIAGETASRSTYRFGPPSRRHEVRFQAKAEAMIPVALASMTAKYLRELAMHAFNAFWKTEVHEIRATAGYPQDARRFALETAAARERLDIDSTIFWRDR